MSRLGVSLLCAAWLGAATAAGAQSAPQQSSGPAPPQHSVPQQPSPQSSPASQSSPQALPEEPPAPQGTAAPSPPPRSLANPGLIEEIGKLLRDSASGLSSSLKGSQQTIDQLNSRAKDAAGHLRLAPQSVIDGRATCPLAANGAPDCKAASDQLCAAKGYKEGKSLDIESAEKCPAKVYLSGRTGAPGECRMEYYVTRAVCQ